VINVPLRFVIQVHLDSLERNFLSSKGISGLGSERAQVMTVLSKMVLVNLRLGDAASRVDESL